MHNVPEFLRFVEDLLTSATVLITRDGEAVKTGFFVSPDGHVCSCDHHTELAEPGTLGAIWRGVELSLEQIPGARDDMALFRIPELKGASTPVLPLLTELPSSEIRLHPAVTVGYAGLTNRDTAVAIRAFEGRLGDVRLRQVGGRQQAITDIELLDLGVGQGNSGAPVLDLSLFRVIGYVQSVVSGTQRMGRARPLTPVLAARPDFGEDWQRAGDEADAAKLAHFASRGLVLPAELTNRRDVAARVRSVSDAAIGQLERAGVYVQDLFVNRSVRAELDRFLRHSEQSLAMLAGGTGTGKTNVLADLVHRVTREGRQALFLSCQDLGMGSLAYGLVVALGIERPAFESLLASDGSTPELLVVLDGVNEREDASREMIQSVVDWVEGLRARHGRSPVKVILSARTEFLEQRIPEFVVASPQDLRADGVDVAAFHHVRRADGRDYPALTIEPLSLDEDIHRTSELGVMYEHYRACGAVERSDGTRVGIRPLTPYEELGSLVRSVIARPIILKLFMLAYNDREAPTNAVRSALVREIVQPSIQARAGSQIASENVEIFLANLAAHLYRNGRKSLRMTELARLPWNDRHLLELVLSQTFILNRTGDSRSAIGGTDIAFSSDWLHEYYLALYVWEECLILDTDVKRYQVIRGLAPPEPDGRATEQMTGALTFFGEWAMTREPTALGTIMMVMASNAYLGDRLVAAFFEFVRTNYGYSETVPPESGSDGRPFLDHLLRSGDRDLSPTFLGRVLDYAHRLHGPANGDAITLLADDLLLSSLTPGLRARRQTVLAHKHFMRHQIGVALATAEQAELTDADVETRAEHAFVVGRCHQFEGRHDQAMQAYRRGMDSPSYFGYMCNHQTAFIRFIHGSDYVGATELLRRIIGDGDDRAATSRRLASRLLYATILVELGRYDEARAIVDQNVEILTARGRDRERGKTLRVLAEMHYRRFDIDAAVATVEESLRWVARDPHYLTIASVLDTKALILAALSGDLDQATTALDRALAQSTLAGHPASASWSLQSKAFVEALAGATDDVDRNLDRAVEVGVNPNQQRRARLIRLLSEWIATGKATSGQLEAARTLAGEYERSGNSWYPGVLALLTTAMAGGSALNKHDAAACFTSDVVPQSVVRSFLFRRVMDVAPGSD